MVSLTILWLPILLSAVFVFIVSSVLHMVFTYHNSDFKRLEKEKDVMDALRPFDLSEGEYAIPHAKNNKERQTPEYKEKLKNGPVAFINVFPRGEQSMGKSLVLWFVYCLIVSAFTAYLSGAAMGNHTGFRHVFNFGLAASFLGYSVGILQESIWFNRSWSTTLKSMFDGLIYALVTVGTFVWLWQ